jgi:hypothetical protein
MIAAPITAEASARESQASGCDANRTMKAARARRATWMLRASQRAARWGRARCMLLFRDIIVRCSKYGVGRTACTPVHGMVPPGVRLRTDEVQAGGFVFQNAGSALMGCPDHLLTVSENSV